MTAFPPGWFERLRYRREKEEFMTHVATGINNARANANNETFSLDVLKEAVEKLRDLKPVEWDHGFPSRMKVRLNECLREMSPSEEEDREEVLQRFRAAYAFGFPRLHWPTMYGIAEGVPYERQPEFHISDILHLRTDRYFRILWRRAITEWRRIKYASHYSRN